MYPEILHLYGPFSIQSYGLMIAIGLVLATWCADRHPLRKRYMSSDEFINLIILGACGALFGGRLLYILTQWHTLDHWYEIFFIWLGGLSLLGSVLCCGIAIPLYLWYTKIPILPCLDLIGIHAPLLQSISRIGCFLAGCCYGKMVQSSWCMLHPTQLYSAFILLIIFFLLRWMFQTKSMHQGQLFALYLMMTNAERFFVDFFRGDQEFYTMTFWSLLSIHQWISLIFFSIGLLSFMIAMSTRTYSRVL